MCLYASVPILQGVALTLFFEDCLFVCLFVILTSGALIKKKKKEDCTASSQISYALFFSVAKQIPGGIMEIS